jgi:hypothetical protein
MRRSLVVGFSFSLSSCASTIGKEMNNTRRKLGMGVAMHRESIVAAEALPALYSRRHCSSRSLCLQHFAMADCPPTPFKEFNH